MNKYKCVIAYDGSAYLGWQKTGMGASVEDVLERVLSTILQQKISLEAASRTDAGVHASGQVAAFFADCPDLEKLKKSLRSMLPSDISLISLEECGYDFHPSTDCIKKEYHYWICTSRYPFPHLLKTCWHYPKRPDLIMMRKEAEQLIGTHDFSAFQNVSENPVKNGTVRTLYEIAVHEHENSLLQIVLIGDGFLYKMARNIAGTLMDIATGRLAMRAEEVLKSKERKNSGQTAPAKGLFLARVYYPKEYCSFSATY